MPREDKPYGILIKTPDPCAPEIKKLVNYGTHVTVDASRRLYQYLNYILAHPLTTSRYTHEPAPIVFDPLNRSYQPVLPQYQLTEDLHNGLERALSWRLYIRQEHPTYIDEENNFHIIPNEVRIGPTLHYRILYTNIVGYIIHTAKEGGLFKVDPVRLQLLRAHSKNYYGVHQANNRSWNSDFFVYIEFFEQYIPGVILEILILYFPKWYQWYSEANSGSIFPTEWKTGPITLWLCREIPIFFQTENPTLGNWKIPDFYKELLDTFETGIKALNNSHFRSTFSNTRPRSEE